MPKIYFKIKKFMDNTKSKTSFKVSILKKEFLLFLDLPYKIVSSLFQPR